MEDSFIAYGQRIDSDLLAEAAISEKSGKTKSPAGRFRRNGVGEWEPLDHQGYTIITPPFEDELSEIKTYTKLCDIQHILLEQLTISKYAPAPVTTMHLTVADLIAGKKYEDRVKEAEEENLLQLLASIFIKLSLHGSIQMEVLGVSVFPSGFVIAIVSASDENGYKRLISFSPNNS